MQRSRHVLLAGIILTALLWWGYVPERVDPSPLPAPNPSGETIQVCDLLSLQAVKDLLNGVGTVKTSNVDVEHYQSEADRIATSMYMVECHYTYETPCRASAATSSTGREIVLFVVPMRDQERAMDRWQAGYGAALRSDPSDWIDGQILGRPSYEYVSSDGRGVVNLWDQRFILSLGLRPCETPNSSDGQLALRILDHSLAQKLALPAASFVSSP